MNRRFVLDAEGRASEFPLVRRTRERPQNKVPDNSAAFKKERCHTAHSVAESRRHGFEKNLGTSNVAVWIAKCKGYDLEQTARHRLPTQAVKPLKMI